MQRVAVIYVVACMLSTAAQHIDPQCSSHHACQGLPGNCCPTPFGDWLGCCPHPVESLNFTCTSDRVFEGRHMMNKGFAVDDTTFRDCSHKIPHLWPNTNEKVASIRIFNAWPFGAPDNLREQSWARLVTFVKSSRVKVLIGTMITCREEDDDRDWRLVKQLLSKLGVANVMGLAVGNEVDLLWTQDYIKHFPECIDNMWQGGYYWRKTQERIADLDALGGGFEQLPVTAALSGASVQGNPFWNNREAMVTSYLTNAMHTYGQRWVFMFNIYSYFHPFQLDTGTDAKCDAAIRLGTCWNSAECIMMRQLIELRSKISQLTGQHNDPLWIGEVGWSSPMPDFFKQTLMGHCPDFSSKNSMSHYYSGFLDWNLELPGLVGPEHAFYFTIRDSQQFGNWEHFGLIDGCNEAFCKINDQLAEAVVTETISI